MKKEWKKRKKIEKKKKQKKNELEKGCKSPNRKGNGILLSKLF